jgi:hypothetical protein
MIDNRMMNHNLNHISYKPQTSKYRSRNDINQYKSRSWLVTIILSIYLNFVNFIWTWPDCFPSLTWLVICFITIVFCLLLMVHWGSYIFVNCNFCRVYIFSHHVHLSPHLIWIWFIIVSACSSTIWSYSRWTRTHSWWMERYIIVYGIK